jgi:hypothetical protein
MEILDYNVIKNNNFDRTKSYFSCYYKSIILFTDYDAKSYNFSSLISFLQRRIGKSRFFSL